MSNWLANITPSMIQRAQTRPGSADTTGQFGGQRVVDQRSQTSQDEADRARYSDRYREAARQYRKWQGYDDPEEGASE